MYKTCYVLFNVTCSSKYENTNKKQQFILIINGKDDGHKYY